MLTLPVDVRINTCTEHEFMLPELEYHNAMYTLSYRLQAFKLSLHLEKYDNNN